MKPVIIIAIVLVAGIGVYAVVYSTDDVIFEGIPTNPLQVYEINTVCELADLILENRHSFSSYNEDFEKRVPTEWNEWRSTLDAEDKFMRELTDEQRDGDYLTTEAEMELQELEKKVRPAYYKIIMKYFSINPDLKGEFALLFPNDPYNLLWLKEKHPECTQFLEEKYG